MSTWKYGIVTKPIPYDPAEIHDEQFAQLVSASMDDVARIIDSPPPGASKPIEFVSHNIAQVGTNLFLTVLFKYRASE